MTPRRRAACSACHGSREPTWMRSGAAGAARPESRRCHLRRRGRPSTKARARPSSPGDQSKRRTASGERTCSVSPAAGPSDVPSQNSNRTGGRAAEEMCRSGAIAAATPTLGLVSADWGLLRPQWARPGDEVRSHHCLLVNCPQCYAVNGSRRSGNIRVRGSDGRRARGGTAAGNTGSARPGGDGERRPARP